MSTPILTRKQTPFDGVPPEVFADLAAFMRRVAPRWVDGSRSLNWMTQRRAHQRELARSRRRGKRLVPAPATSVSSGRVVRHRGR
jgi:hypothetical protein